MLYEQEVITVPQIPHSKDAEEALLGSVLINPDMLPLVRGVINHDEDFYIIRNRQIWSMLCGMNDRHVSVDLVTLSDELDRNGLLAQIGGPAYLTGLISHSPNSSNAEDYAQIIHHHGIRRRMITAANTVAQNAYDESKEIGEVVTKSIEAVYIASNGLIGGRAQEAGQLASEHYEASDKLFNQKSLPGINTGIVDLDVKLGGGLQDTNLIVIGGFPGGGKSSILAGIAAHAAKSCYVDLYTLEMSNQQVTNRILSQMTKIDSQRMKSRRLEDKEYPLYTHAIEEFSSYHLRIDDTAPLSIPTLRAKCVQHKSMGELDLVVLDYAGLMEAPGKSLYEKGVYLSRYLKLLAKELDVPVLVAMQFSREASKQGKPTMYNFRDSGSWEQDADVAMLIYPSEAESMGEGLPYNLEIAKQRDGPTGIIDLLFFKFYTKFEPAVSKYFNPNEE